jgi:hypothetical protein
MQNGSHCTELECQAARRGGEGSTNTIVRFERGEDLKARTVADIRETFETAGIDFIDGEYAGSGGPGVRLTVAET